MAGGFVDIGGIDIGAHDNLGRNFDHILDFLILQMLIDAFYSLSALHEGVLEDGGKNHTRVQRCLHLCEQICSDNLHLIIVVYVH